jgi:hypothetical protein
MKKIILLFSLVIGVSSFAQKNYAFNYMLLYGETCMNHRNAVDFAYLVNSSKNNAVVSVLDNGKGDDLENYNLSFHDFEGNHVHSVIKRNEFYSAETITASTGDYTDFSSMTKSLFKNFYFENLKDTVINDTSYYHYTFKNSKKEKYRAKKNIGVTHFIVAKDAAGFLPILSSPFEYEVWKRDKNIPNGYLKMRYYIDYNGAKKSKMELVKMVSTKRYFDIPKRVQNAGLNVYKSK